MSFTVLMYHEFRERGGFDPGRASTISVAEDYRDALPPVLFSWLDDFRAQMRYLKNGGYHTLTLQEIRDFYEKGTALPEKSVLLTFDDAFQSVYHYAYPVLKELGLHAVAFVVLGWLTEETQPFDPATSTVMSRQELQMMRDVFEFANHTTHLHRRQADGTTALQTVSNEELQKDLALCGESVDVPDVLAYPFGIYTSADTGRLAAAGIRYAFTTAPGRNTADTPPLELHRNTVFLGCSVEQLAKILTQGEENK